MTRQVRRALGGIAVLASAALVMSACSTASSGGSGGAASTPAGGSSGSGSSNGVAAATALLNKYSGEPAFVSPGPSFDASKAKGKILFGLPVNTSVAYVNTVDKETQKFAKALGLKYIDYANQQQQSQWIQGVSNAVSAKANVISLIGGLPPEQLAPQLTQAQKGGMGVVDLAERNQGQPTESYVNSYVYAPFAEAGTLMGAYAVKATNGNADVLIISSNADVSSPPVVNGASQEIKSTCPSCKIKTVNVNPTDWATKLQSTVEGALSSDPNINYILPVYDSMAEFVAPAIQTAGRSGKTFIATFNGTPAILDMMRTGNTVQMDVADNTSDVALAGLDAAMRLMLKLPAGKQQIGLRVFTKDNVTDAGTPAQSGKGFGTSSATGYAKTWGVSASLLQG